MPPTSTHPAHSSLAPIRFSWLFLLLIGLTGCDAPDRRGETPEGAGGRPIPRILTTFTIFSSAQNTDYLMTCAPQPSLPDGRTAIQAEYLDKGKDRLFVICGISFNAL